MQSKPATKVDDVKVSLHEGEKPVEIKQEAGKASAPAAAPTTEAAAEKKDPIELTNPDWLSPEEQKAYEELKKYDVAKRVSEKWAYICLFARKLDVKRTAELLEAHEKFRAEHKFPARIPLSSCNIKVLQSGYTWIHQGHLDPEGRQIAYIVLRNFNPKEYTLQDMIRFTVWYLDYCVRTMPIGHFRKGTVYVEDLAGFTSKNAGKMSDSSTLMKTFQNTMPLRIRGIYILNPGFVFKILIKIAKFFMKAKIVQRVQIVDEEKLRGLVGRKNLIKEYGGDVDYDHKAWVDKVIAEERELDEQEAKEREAAAAKDATSATTTGAPGGAAVAWHE